MLPMVLQMFMLFAAVLNHVYLCGLTGSMLMLVTVTCVPLKAILMSLACAVTENHVCSVGLQKWESVTTKGKADLPGLGCCAERAMLKSESCVELSTPLT